MRTLSAHQIDALNRALDIAVLDEPNAAGVCNDYRIRYVDPQGVGINSTVLFQQGNPETEGVNGVTFEALLAIMLDRLMGMQSGPFACRENAEAVDHLEQALGALDRRRQRLTKERSNA